MRTIFAVAVILVLAGFATAGEEIFLPSGPDVSPDGKTVVFSWHDDLWTVPIEGGTATRLTTHPAKDSAPFYSPSGDEIAFVSDRETGEQVFVMPASGGTPRQLTFDTNGANLLGWFPDGLDLLVTLPTEREWRRNWRLFAVSVLGGTAPTMLFDSEARNGQVSPDGRRILFNRGGMAWWWKGYRGAKSAQVWTYDLETKEYTKHLHRETGCRYPRWMPDGKGFLFTDMADGEGNLRRFDLATGETAALTEYDSDTAVSPTVHAGGVIVFRHRFDLYRMAPGGKPERIAITVEGDRERRVRERRNLKSASVADFTKDGLEIAFIAGGDLFVMDTVLKEPVAVTVTPADETECAFIDDGKAILFFATKDGQGDLWRAERKNAKSYWWQNDEFVLTPVSEAPVHERGLVLSPDRKRIAFVRGRGDLVVMKVDGTDERVLTSSFNPPSIAWSPDGHWIAWAVQDADFNSDIWIGRSDGTGEPVNVTRHPDSDWEPAWSSDGKILAFLSRRRETETDIHYVWLREEDEDETKRDRTVEEALEKMKKGRKPPKPPKKKEPETKAAPEGKAPAAKEPAPVDPAAEPPADPKAPPVEPSEPPVEPSDPPAEPKETPPAEKEGESEKAEPAKKPEKKEPEPLAIDFDRIHDRVRSISIPNVSESGLFWSPDGKKLAFAATIDGKRGTYTVSFPDDLKPKLMTTTTGSDPVWVKQKNGIRWVVRGSPAVTAGPKTETHSFVVPQEVDVAGRYAAAFDAAWRIMRDGFYDVRLNNRDWNAIRKKYRDHASRSPDREIFSKIVQMMLGELNGSHAGFSASPERREGYRDEWRHVTGALGIRWDPDHAGPGRRVLSVVSDGPADRAGNRLVAGDVVTTIDGHAIGRTTDLSKVLTGRPDRDVMLLVTPVDGKERTVFLRPTSQYDIRRLLYRQWTRDNEAKVHDASGGKLGYLHIRGMTMGSFYEFERQLFAAGYGREGLVIDVRDNGGGFTADHLLTALTQPSHAYTISRGGSPGYPQDRKVYATWNKPIVVLINQGSFSNAEIFAHAIRTLGRGQLVGVKTAGGVISTGGARVMDFGFIRMPGRGWFLRNDGQDMEQNGARPHHEVWPLPGDAAQGIDRQLDKAVEVLLGDVGEWKKTGQLPKPKYRSAR